MSRKGTKRDGSTNELATELSRMCGIPKETMRSRLGTVAKAMKQSGVGEFFDWLKAPVRERAPLASETVTCMVTHILVVKRSKINT